jgi:nucleoside-diphosphate-sugar epimerase
MLALITGATGFVGQAVCTRFLQAGWQVRGLARRAPRTPLSVSEFKTLDLQRDELEEAMHGADVIVHLAGLAHKSHRSADGSAIFQLANVDASVRLALAAREAGIQRFLFASTAKVHGELSLDQPFAESDAPQPKDAYARSKWEAEQRLADIHPNLTVVRPPLVYGPGVGANFLRLLRLVDRGVPLPLASVGNLRSLVFVHNLADAFYTCATNPKAARRTYLISDQEDISTPMLLKRISYGLRHQARLWPCPTGVLKLAGAACGRGHDLERLLNSFRIDSSRITRELGWHPTSTLAQGLSQTAAWYRSYY